MPRIPWWMLAALAALCAPVVGAEPPIKLYCARDVPGFTDAELTLSASGPHLVSVTFARERPSRHQTEWALMDCLNTASKLDPSKDILATARYRTPEAGSAILPEALEPYGPLARLRYRASTRNVVVDRETP